MNKDNYEYKVGPSTIKCKVESNTISQDIQKPDLSNRIIKSMILLYPHNGSKEMRSIISLVEKVSTKASDVFEKVLISTKLSNKESLFFFEIMGRFPEWLENATVNRVVEYRFAAQDKYLDRLVVEYFRLVLAIYNRLSHEQLVETYYKFIYLFENGICENMVVYRLFQEFLDRGMVGLFLYKRGYMKMRFLKEFLVDFRELGGVLVRIGYERPETRGLVYSLLSESSESNWVLQRWKVYGSCELTISQLFYVCDCLYFMKNMGLRKMELTIDLREALEKELQTATDVCTNSFWCINDNIDSICTNNNTHDNHITDNTKTSTTSPIYYAMERKNKYQQAVMYFNEKGELADKYTAVEMYMSPMVNLSTLGQFLCNYKHADALRAFIGAFCFAGMDLLDALRLFLGGFCLVGEAQIVERVIGLFVETYFAQNNGVEECSEVATEYRNLGYSFLALNTMLHNVVVDKKPSFEDYLRMVGFHDNFFIKKETLREYYISVKDNEIKYPDQWRDSYDKYLMSIDLRKKYFSEVINEKSNTTSSAHSTTTSSANNNTTSSANNNTTTTVSTFLMDSISHIPRNPTKLCRACILTAYKMLFKKAHLIYFSMDPTDFYELCCLIGDQNIYEAYVRHQSIAYKSNIVRIVNCWRHLLENYVLRDEVLLSALVCCANKIDNTRESIFRDLTLLSVRPTHYTGAASDSRDAILGSVHPLYAPPVQTLADIHFANSQVCCANTALLAKARNDLIDKIVVHLILRHIDWVIDLEGYPVSIRNSVIATCPETITRVSPLNRLVYLCTKKELSAADFEVYTSCRIQCDAGFELFCRLQGEYDIFNDYITVSRCNLEDKKYNKQNTSLGKKDAIDISNNNVSNGISNKDIGNKDIGNKDIGNSSAIKTSIYDEKYLPFSVTEFYKDQLSSPKNTLKLFLTSSTVLNPTVVSAAHRPSDPHDKIAYLLIKTDTFKTPLFDHFTAVIESLSDCLPLFLDIVHYVYPLLHCISPDTRSIFLRIFIARLKKYRKNCVACCQENKPPLSAINRIVEQLVADNFIKKDAFPLFSTANVFEI